MNEQQRVDRNARTWLEAGPTQAPDSAVRAALDLIESTPQERDLRVLWRKPVMPIAVRIAAVALLVALAAGGVYLVAGSRPAPAPDINPAVSPAPASPSAASTKGPSASSLATNLTSRFSSPLYGYSIGMDPTWSSMPASTSVDDPASTDANSSDRILIAGTDTDIGVIATALGTQTFDEWLASEHQTAIDGTPPGCAGGDPSTWEAVTVGDRQGVWEQLCNFANAIVHVGNRVYVFAWSNDTFNNGEHMPPSDFRKVLETVTFPATP